MLRVGLTGGIACGKSRVLARFAAAGFHVLDLDRVSHEVMAPGGPAYDEVVRAFGPRVLGPGGEVDRKALGSLVFADAAVRARLNAIVHPRVRQVEARLAARHVGEPGAVVITDAALLVEAGLHLRFDRLLVVHCEPDEQLRRLRHRDGLDEAAARARIDAQMAVEEKRRFAHLVIDATGSFEATDRAADEAVAALRRLAGAPPPRLALPLERGIGCALQGPENGPRGLSPRALLEETAAAGGLEMERLAARLVPPASGPWYRQAGVADPGIGPEVLAGPLAIVAAARGSYDPEWAAAAAHSVARLTHHHPAAIAEACAFTLAFLDAARGQDLDSLATRHAGWTDQGTRWAGRAPSERVRRVAEEAAARVKGGGMSQPPGEGLVAALAGLMLGAPVASAPPPLVSLLRALLEPSAGA